MAVANDIYADFEVGGEIADDISQERAWVEAAGHDPLAFERLYNRYLPRVYAYVFHQTQDKHSSEDLVADTFMKAAQALASGRFRWRHERSFAAWLFRIAHNSVSDYKAGSRKWGDLTPLEEMPDVEANVPLPEEVFLRNEERVHLRRLIGTLSPRRQEIIMLKFFGELRNQEIAAVLGLGERTVSSHLCLAIEDLHRKYVEQSLSNGEKR